MNEDGGKQFVGIDLHRRRSVIVRLDEAGNRIGVVKIANDPAVLTEQIRQAGPAPEVVVEACYGWYWAVDTLRECGATVHLAHPLGVKGFQHRRVKNDVRDAADLADLLRMGRLPEAWIAPPPTRELRELVRYRAKLVNLRSGLKAQVHGVLAKAGVLIPASDLFGVQGRAGLAKVRLDEVYAQRVRSLLDLIDVLDTEVDTFTTRIAARLDGHRGYRTIQQLPGIGPVLAAVLVAEIGEVDRFRGPAQLCSWAGLTPRHRESDTTVHRGKITKQGSRLLRWALVEAIQVGGTTKIRADRDRIADRRGRNIAKIAAARKLLILVYYGLRDGEIRALARNAG
ncbi:IS110 family transposase [Nocardia terpenica]|uniref:Transposase n=1 Tax=Nocardia terpenica TaxID=455432 RepID=A0A164HAP6_9NOCA|nr:IS110 family transposase [Nocardia terpenica]KZM68348.1 transposase [Nocardia terpenica]KZM68530.1 transposase [Nocardia terpenica]KZM69867.1 transposase [Nocardia terpenica]KZM75493.1 transposase [Nocardia terpenica]NQE85964.1 IS110 family transposase [Nocardia terpenica]